MSVIGQDYSEGFCDDFCDGFCAHPGAAHPGLAHYIVRIIRGTHRKGHIICVRARKGL